MELTALKFPGQGFEKYVEVGKGHMDKPWVLKEDCKYWKVGDKCVSVLGIAGRLKLG